MRKTIRVSDAIPEMPLSFEQTVNRTLSKVCAETKEPTRAAKKTAEDRWVPQESMRTKKTGRIGKVFAYSAVAVLLVAVFAIGGVVMKNALFGQENRPNPLSGTEPEAPMASTPAAPTVDNHRVTIRLLPELEEADVYAEHRARALQPAFSEEDWGWIRKMDVSVRDIEIDSSRMSWVTVFRIRPGDKPTRFGQNPFEIIDMTGLDLWEDNHTIVGCNGGKEALSVSQEVMYGTDPTDGAWYVTVYTDMPRYPDITGTVTVDQQFRIIDNRVDGQANIATIALIGQTFSFDTSGAPTPAPTEPDVLMPAICVDGTVYILTDRKLAGEVDGSAILGYVNSLVPLSEWPTKNGQANFDQYGVPYAVVSEGLVVLYSNEWTLFEPTVTLEGDITVEEPTPEPTEKPAQYESSVVPSTFRFWDYDDEGTYDEAPREGVLFRCDFDGDGTIEEITYEIKKSSIRISVLGQSTEIAFSVPHEYADGVYEAILTDLDAESPILNLVLVYYSWESGCDSIELHMEKGKLVKGTNVSAGWASLNAENNALVMQEDTELFGTQQGVRTYSGDGMHPDSEWLTLAGGVTEEKLSSEREELIEAGKLLHLRRDLPCMIDGETAVIPAGSYLYVLRYHESETLVEICTEDGTTATVTVERADPNDPELYEFLIDGVMQEEYFDNIFFAG